MLSQRLSVQKSFAILALLLVGGPLLFSSCAPPSSQQSQTIGGSDGGRPIMAVAQKTRPAFQDQVIDGVEYQVSRGPVGQAGGTFFAAQLGEGPKTFNPWASMDATSSTLGDMMTSGLVRLDAYSGQVMPYLAKSVEILPDKLTYRVVLRKGLTWSDGKPITAKDVVFTWNEIINKGLGNASQRDNTQIDGKSPVVTLIDSMTVEFKTAKPFAPFLRMLGMSIAPAHVFEPIIQKEGDKAFGAAWGTSQAAKKPGSFVSSGMWLLEKYEPGQHVVFKRNPHFFMVDARGTHLPYLERYDIRFVKDLNNIQLQFEQGNIDAYGVSGKFVSHVRKLTQPAFNLYNLGPASGTTFLAFNLNAKKLSPKQAHWFTNQKFRQAVDWAVNRDDMVKNILRGVGQALYTSESPSSIFLNQALAKGHPVDVDKAKALLKEAGFSWDKSGQLLDDKGNAVEFTLMTNTGNDDREATGVSIKQDLSKLGMQVHFKPMEFNVLVNALSSGQWEAIIMGLTGSTTEPHDGANVWRSTGSLHLFNQQDPKAPASKRVIFPWEQEIDQLIERGAITFDFKARKQIYDQMQQIIYDQQPLIYLYSPLSIAAVKQRIQNYDPTPLGEWHNLEEIWIQPSK